MLAGLFSTISFIYAAMQANPSWFIAKGGGETPEQIINLSEG